MTMEENGLSCPTQLTTEYRVDPLGLDTPCPRFCWKNESPRWMEDQTAYQVLVSKSSVQLAKNIGEIWDSGIIRSDQSVHVEYAGLPLTSGTRYYWKVRCWNRDGTASDYSCNAVFETGLLYESDWKAEWLAVQSGVLLRKEFEVQAKAVNARMYVTAAGLYECYLNGAKIGDHVLEPAWTDYEDRVLYQTYDVTEMLHHGSNVIGAMVGLGAYRYHGTSPLDYKGGGAPKLLLQLNVTYEDGTCLIYPSDSSWRMVPGPVVSEHFYAGETYDARLQHDGWKLTGFDDRSWPSAIVDTEFRTRLEASVEPPIRAIGVVTPSSIWSPAPDIYVLDMGNNYAGRARLTVHGKAGMKITLKYGEVLESDERVSTRNLWGSNTNPEQTDCYIVKGSGIEVWEPTFTYKGFRYLEITGYPGILKAENIAGVIIHSDVETTGRFSSSNNLLNIIQAAILRTQANNLHGLPEDCPTRERRGWGADAHVTAEEAMYNFDMAAFYSKWAGDLRTSQREDGGVFCVAPGKDMFVDPAWGIAYTLIPWYMYKFYADIRIIQQHYEGTKKWISYLTSRSSNHILLNPEHTWGNDWLSLQETPGALFRTGFYYWNVQIAARMAELLGYEAEATKYNELSGAIRTEFNKVFYNRDTGDYGNGSQFSNALPLFLNLVVEEHRNTVLDRLVGDIRKRNYHLTGGILGTKYIIDTLDRYDRSDVLYDTVTRVDENSWGYMLETGPGTIWESWSNGVDGSGTDSKNHPALCSIGAWFYRGLAGIDQEESSCGFRETIIRPQPIGDLTECSATVQTMYGIVSSAWFIKEGLFSLEVGIPSGTSAIVKLPFQQNEIIAIQEESGFEWIPGIAKGSLLDDRICWRGQVDKYATLSIRPGQYRFHVKHHAPPLFKRQGELLRPQS